MKKYSLHFVSFVSFLALFSCGKNPENIPTKTPENYITPNLPSTYNSTLDEEKKVQLAIERRKEQTQIRKGDYMMSKNNPRAALEYYLPLLEKLPDDVVLFKKIGDAYLGLKDWKNAYAHYVRVPLSELKKEDRENMIAALFALSDTYDRKTELQKFSFTENEKKYYNTMNECYLGIEHCVDILWNYE